MLNDKRRKVLNATREKQRARLWAFVNSSFGIWLIGTALAGIAVWTVNEVRLARRTERAVAALKSEVRAEIELRLREALRAAYDTPGEPGPGPALTTLDTAFKNPRFRNHRFDALIQEYARQLPISDIREQLVQDAVASLTGLRSTSRQPPSPEVNELARHSLRSIDRALRTAEGTLRDDCKIPPERLKVAEP